MPTQPPLQQATLNSICLYTSAFLLTVLLHELGHAVAGLLVGDHPVFYNSHVENTAQNLSSRALLLIALAGPLVSLGQGLVLLAVARHQRGTGSGQLWCLYLGLFGLINFLGYVLTGPFVAYGDLGQAEALLHLPPWLRLAAAVGATGLLVVVVRGTGRLFLRFVPAASTAEPVAAFTRRRQFLRGLIVWPWLVGSGLILALSWPLPTLLSLIYPPMSSMVLGSAFGAALRLPDTAALRQPAPVIAQRQWLPALGLLVIAVVYRMLQSGVAL